uniref:Uncharacterized protein n=1 Tax=Octopus bimaculoides TaxID=37653 RepID=A0A0L8HUE5_OCTBM
MLFLTNIVRHEASPWYKKDWRQDFYTSHSQLHVREITYHSELFNKIYLSLF